MSGLKSIQNNYELGIVFFKDDLELFLLFFNDFYFKEFRTKNIRFFSTINNACAKYIIFCR